MTGIDELVSIIIPTYNRGDVISRSIKSALRQTYTCTEIIVVDDCSEDNTERIIKDNFGNRVKYIKHDANRGGSAARNTGIKSANGDYLAFLDSDDEWVENKLELQMKYISASDYIGVYCDIKRIRTGNLSFLRKILREMIGGDELPGKEGGEELIRDSLLLKNFSTGGCSTILAKKEPVIQINGFDPDFPRHQDWEFRNRLLEKGKLGYVDEPLVHKYETDSPDSTTTEKATQMYLTKFSDRIQILENEGYNVKGRHNLRLATRFFGEGNFKKGIEYFRKSKITSPKQYITLSYSISKGVLKNR
jgi:glycosyltransferase involved in cell wall biosynthesis